MSKWCAAVNCKNNSGQKTGRSFFLFPKDPERCKRWVIACHRKDLENRDSQYISKNCTLCSDHFEPFMFLNDLRNRLHSHAVPSLFNVPNPPPTVQPKRKTPLKKQATSDTKSKHSDVKLPEKCWSEKKNVRRKMRTKRRAERFKDTIPSSDTSCTLLPDASGNGTMEVSVLIDGSCEEISEDLPIISFSCRVKTEPVSDDEQHYERESFVDYSTLDITIKRENTEVDADDHSLIRDETNQVKVSEAKDDGAEMNEQKNALSDDVIKSKNDEFPVNIGDDEVSDFERTSDTTGCIEMQQNCRTVESRSWILKKRINKPLCYTNEEGHTCCLCGKVFTSNQTCLWHIWKKHTIEEPYICELCGKAFKRKQYLVRHKACHSDKRPHLCDVCGKTFKHLVALNHHKAARHSNKKPYSVM